MYILHLYMYIICTCTLYVLDLNIAGFSNQYCAVTLKVDESRPTPSVRVTVVSSAEPHTQRTVEKLELSRALETTDSLVSVEVLANSSVGVGRVVTGVVESTTHCNVPTVLAI